MVVIVIFVTYVLPLSFWSNSGSYHLETLKDFAWTDSVLIRNIVGIKGSFSFWITRRIGNFYTSRNIFTSLPALLARYSLTLLLLARTLTLKVTLVGKLEPVYQALNALAISVRFSKCQLFPSLILSLVIKGSVEPVSPLTIWIVIGLSCVTEPTLLRLTVVSTWTVSWSEAKVAGLFLVVVWVKFVLPFFFVAVTVEEYEGWSAVILFSVNEAASLPLSSFVSRDAVFNVSFLRC